MPCLIKRIHLTDVSFLKSINKQKNLGETQLKTMKQYEQVIAVMEENGGWATLGFLYHKVDTSEWKTKTPFATIRRIVQDERFFFKIKAGLWALKSHKEQFFRKI